jgi:hypothetical protein
MNTHLPYIDASYCYTDITRSFDIHTTSASPSSYYVQEPMQNSNFQHVNSNLHASATPEIYMPMNNMMNYVSQYETPNVINFNSMQNNVSSFYPSANNLQYFGSSSRMPMDREISHDTTSCLNNYSQPSYAAPHVTNFSAPYATPNIHYSAVQLHNTYGRIIENSIEAHAPSSNTIAYDTPPKQLQNFGNTQVSMPKIIERSKERSSKEWVEDLVEKILEAIAIQRKKGDSISTANSAKAVLDNTCVGSNQQEVNIAEPSSVEKHQTEEAQNPENKEDKKLENHQEVEQDIVQVIQRPYSPNVIDFDNKKILIRSYQTESTKEKNIVIDINAAPRMIKNSEVVVSKRNERKKQVASRPKPIVKQLLDKYTHRKDNHMFNRLGGTKCYRSPAGPRGHKSRRANSYVWQPYFAMELAHWGCAPPVYPRLPSQGVKHWAPYRTRPGVYFQQEYVSPRYMFRPHFHAERARFNQKARSHDAAVIRGNRLSVGSADGKNYKGNQKFVWVPVKHAEPKSVESSVDLNVAHSLKRAEHQTAECVVSNPETHEFDRSVSGSGQGKGATGGKKAFNPGL